VSRIVVLGDVMMDVVARMSGPLAPGSDSPAAVSVGGGGSAANVAAWLAAAGARPVLVGRVGDDARGEAVAAELREAGVDARLAVDDERPTGTCIVLVGPGGERAMVPDPGPTWASRPPTCPTTCWPPAVTCT
jgi:sugar/nucleoside kinase (ribokinase family)